MLGNGTYATIAEIAMADKISEILRRPRPAPDAIGTTTLETILNGQQSSDLHLDALMKAFPVQWQAQLDSFGC